MNRKIIFLMMALLLVGTVIGAITLNNKSVKIDSARQIKAVELGINVYDTIDEQQGDLYRRCLISRSEYNLPCSTFMQQDRLDQWENDTVYGDDGILQVQIDRDNKIDPVKVGEGITTLSK